MVDAGGGVDGRFDDAGDGGIDHIRIRAAQGGGDHDNGEINGRNAVNADALIGDEAEQNDDAREHPSENVAFDGDFGQAHIKNSNFVIVYSFFAKIYSFVIPAQVSIWGRRGFIPDYLLSRINSLLQ